MKSFPKKRRGKLFLRKVLLSNKSFRSTDSFCVCRSAVAPRAVILLCQDWTIQSQHRQDTNQKVTTQLAGTGGSIQWGTAMVSSVHWLLEWHGALKHLQCVSKIDACFKSFKNSNGCYIIFETCGENAIFLILLYHHIPWCEWQYCMCTFLCSFQEP